MSDDGTPEPSSTPHSNDLPPPDSVLEGSYVESPRLPDPDLPPSARGRAGQFVESLRERISTAFAAMRERRARRLEGGLLTPADGDGNPTATAGGMLGALRARLDRVDPEALLRKLQSGVSRERAATYGRIGTVVISAFFVSDLTALWVGRMIPDPPPARAVRSGTGDGQRRTEADYEPIIARNLFNKDGRIPGEANGDLDPKGEPTKSSLPLSLVGVLVLRDELRSIATLEDKGSQTVYPLRIQDEIPGKLRVTRIEPRRVVFVNTGVNRLEFIELPDDMGINPRISLSGPAAPSAAPGASIQQASETQFSIPRAEVDKVMGDLNNVLTQARAIPNFENGAPAGYKLFQIVPGSIYDKLGLKNGDVLSALDGQALNDPGQAFNMLNRLKEASHLDLTIKRDGKTQTNSYDFR